jgi:hypothetical protein
MESHLTNQESRKETGCIALIENMESKVRKERHSSEFLIQIKHPGDSILYSFYTANVMPAKLRPQ